MHHVKDDERGCFTSELVSPRLFETRVLQLTI